MDDRRALEAASALRRLARDIDDDERNPATAWAQASPNGGIHQAERHVHDETPIADTIGGVTSADRISALSRAFAGMP